MRFRKDLGDLTELKKSISEVGLIQPIVVSTTGELIAGERRLRACEELGIEPIYRMVDFTYPERAQIEENTIRKDFTPEEIYEIGKYYNEKLSKQGERTDKQLRSESEQSSKKPIEIVAGAVGKHPSTISQINAIFESDDTQLKEKVNKGKVTINQAYKQVKKNKKHQQKQQRQEEAAKINDEIKQNITDITGGWHRIGNQYLYYGSNLDKEFIDSLPKCKYGFADPPYNADVADWDSNFKWEQDLFIDKCNVFAVTPGGWEAFNFYKQTNMPYVWEVICHIINGMTHGRCGYANYIKASIFSNDKVKISQDLFSLSINTSETGDTSHKGRKPYGFIAELMNMFSQEGDLVFDIFAGSGTTLLLSEKFNRISYNAEISKQFCIDIINRGIENGMKYHGRQSL